MSIDSVQGRTSQALGSGVHTTEARGKSAKNIKKHHGKAPTPNTEAEVSLSSSEMESMLTQTENMTATESAAAALAHGAAPQQALAIAVAKGATKEEAKMLQKLIENVSSDPKLQAAASNGIDTITEKDLESGSTKHLRKINKKKVSLKTSDNGMPSNHVGVSADELAALVKETSGLSATEAASMAMAEGASSQQVLAVAMAQGATKHEVEQIKSSINSQQTQEKGLDQSQLMTVVDQTDGMTAAEAVSQALQQGATQEQALAVAVAKGATKEEVTVIGKVLGVKKDSKSESKKSKKMVVNCSNKPTDETIETINVMGGINKAGVTQNKGLSASEVKSLIQDSQGLKAKEAASLAASQGASAEQVLAVAVSRGASEEEVAQIKMALGQESIQPKPNGASSKYNASGNEAVLVKVKKSGKGTTAVNDKPGPGLSASEVDELLDGSAGLSAMETANLAFSQGASTEQVLALAVAKGATREELKNISVALQSQEGSSKATAGSMMEASGNQRVGTREATMKQDSQVQAPILEALTAVSSGASVEEALEKALEQGASAREALEVAQMISGQSGQPVSQNLVDKIQEKEAVEKGDRFRKDLLNKQKQTAASKRGNILLGTQKVLHAACCMFIRPEILIPSIYVSHVQHGSFSHH